MDIFSPEQRSRVMAAIRSKGTGPERALFSLAKPLWGICRYRRHAKNLPGTPDLAFPRARVAVFVDGDFWHGKMPPSRFRKLPAKWRKKLRANMARDRRVGRELAALGWREVRILESALKKFPARQLARVRRAVLAGLAR